MEKKIYIELNSRRLYLKGNTKNLATYPVAIGKPETPTPIGDFQIINMMKNPGGVLGTRWMQFTGRMHGIHGTNQPESIGKAVSLGCVRMYNHDVEKLYSQVNTGTKVIIRNIISSDENNKTDNYFIYTVNRGDSLWKISRKYSVSIEEIKRLNNLKNTTIYPGQQLRIPLNQAK